MQQRTGTIELLLVIILFMSVFNKFEQAKAETVPTVQVYQQINIEYYSGGTITLPCYVKSNLSITSVYWQKSNYNGTTTIYARTNLNKYSIGNENKPSLTIFFSTKSDEGTYTCFASNSVGIGHSTNITLNIRENGYFFPIVKVQRLVYAVNTGSSVTLECSVIYALSKDIHWEYYDRSLSFSNPNKYSIGNGNTPSLTIFFAAKSDAGKYTCVARNGMGQTRSKSITLSVIGSIPTVAVEHPSYSVDYGQSVLLKCSVISDLDIISVYWQRNADKTTTNITSSTNIYKYQVGNTDWPYLTIFSATQDDAGNYTCFASNSIGTGQSTASTLSVSKNIHVPTVTVKEAQYSIKSGNSILLDCSVISDLEITLVYWQIKVDNITRTVYPNTNIHKYSIGNKTEPSLTVFNVAKSDAGSYTCFAGNSLALAQSTTAKLNVIGNYLTVTVQQPTYTVTSGSSVTLVCSILSELPITQVFWQRDISGTIKTINSNTNPIKYSIGNSNTPSLTIFNAEQSDAGTYTCFASNGFDTGHSTTITLSLTEVPDHISTPQNLNQARKTTIAYTITAILDQNINSWYYISLCLVFVIALTFSFLVFKGKQNCLKKRTTKTVLQKRNRTYETESPYQFVDEYQISDISDDNVAFKRMNKGQSKVEMTNVAFEYESINQSTPQDKANTSSATNIPTRYYNNTNDTGYNSLTEPPSDNYHKYDKCRTPEKKAPYINQKAKYSKSAPKETDRGTQLKERRL